MKTKHKSAAGVRGKPPVTPQQRHHTHPVIIRPGRGPHAGEIYCVQCKKHVQWLTQQAYNSLTQQETAP
jgi:hypothetical protein